MKKRQPTIPDGGQVARKRRYTDRRRHSGEVQDEVSEKDHLSTSAQ